MDTYHVVLYLHLLSLFVALGAAAIMGLCIFRLRAATTLAEALPWGTTSEKTVRAFPIAIVGLFATGAYMTSDVWTWDTGWIDVSIAGLAIVALQGPLVGGRAGHALEQALKANGPGELGEAARRAARAPAMWFVEFANVSSVLGIVWNMTTKPGTAGAIASLVVAYAVGAAVGVALSRASAVPAATAGEPAS